MDKRLNGFLVKKCFASWLGWVGLGWMAASRSVGEEAYAFFPLFIGLNTVASHIPCLDMAIRVCGRRVSSFFTLPDLALFSLSGPILVLLFFFNAIFYYDYVALVLHKLSSFYVSV